MVLVRPPRQVDRNMDNPGADGRIDDLPDSRLGTKVYWDQVYQQEVENLNDHGEEGEIWFGLTAEKRVVDWIYKEWSPKSPIIVDVGCGNGHFCLSLAKKGFDHIIGMDYSDAACQLAEALAEKECISCIKYKTGDLLSPDSVESLDADIVVDKGTFDAICLGSLDEIPENCSTKSEFFAHVYARSLRKMAKSKHTLIITSCNWTEDELVRLFSKERYTRESTISHPSFAFGGSKGSTVSTVIFRSQ